MPFPSYSEYIDQITTALDQYQHLQPVKKTNGDLYYSTGNFGVVIKMIEPNTQQFYGIKCFTREKTNLLKRYKEIANYIKANPSKYIIPIEFLEKELYIDSSITDENEFPALIMPWIEGIPLNYAIKEACKNNDNEALRQIFTQFLDMSIWLLKQNIAHTDLKPDNILYNEHTKSMVIVDYDGMYIPNFSNQAQAEGGTSGYIHPTRANQQFDRHLDDFSILIIALSLQMLLLDNSLFEIYSNDTNLLFTQKDYNQLTSSDIYKEINNLKKDFPAIGVLGELLNYTLSSQTAEIPKLNKILEELKKHSLVQRIPTLKELEKWYEQLSEEWKKVLIDNSISKNNIFKILEIKEINTSFQNFESLDGLYYAINIEELNLYKSINLTDISALKNLKKLKIIILSDCNLKSLDGLENATELEELYLNANVNLSDISPLKNLKKLKEINLNWCDLISLNGLENATELEELYLNWNYNLSDISALKNLKKLKKIKLESCDLKSLNGLENATELEELKLYENKNLSDISALKNLKNLKIISLSSCDLKSLNGLENAIELEGLYLSENKNLSDFSALKNLKKLKKIDLRDCDLKSLNGLENATELEELVLCKNKNLSNFSALKNLKKLKKISLSDCNLITLNGLENAVELEVLNLNENENLSDFSALKNLKKLKKIALRECDLKSLNGLENAIELEELNLYGNRNLSDITALKNLKKLNKIDFAYSVKISDLIGYEYIKHLY